MKNEDEYAIPFFVDHRRPQDTIDCQNFSLVLRMMFDSDEKRGGVRACKHKRFERHVLSVIGFTMQICHLVSILVLSYELLTLRLEFQLVEVM